MLIVAAEVLAGATIGCGLTTIYAVRCAGGALPVHGVPPVAIDAVRDAGVVEEVVIFACELIRW